MWRPVISDSTDLLIMSFAVTAIQKELNRVENEIEKKSAVLSQISIKTHTKKNLMSKRRNLDALCSQRDRLEKALERLGN